MSYNGLYASTRAPTSMHSFCLLCLKCISFWLKNYSKRNNWFKIDKRAKKKQIKNKKKKKKKKM